MNQLLFRRHHPERRFHLDGKDWGVIDTGGAPGQPTLLMLPGTLGTASLFWNQILALRARARVVALTLPAITRIDRLADSLARLLLKLRVGPATVVGSSLGGYLAQMLAARHPARVKSLVIGNSLSDPPMTRQVTNHIPPSVLESLPAGMHQGIILASVRNWPVPEPAVATLKRLLIESGTHHLGPRKLKSRVLVVQAGGTVPKLRLPSTRIAIIDCADDPLLPRAVQDDVVQRYPGAAHYRLPAGGHYPYVLRADRYTEILARHLA